MRIRIEHRKPREASMLPNLVVSEPVLPVAPRSKHQLARGIGIDNAMRPFGRNHDLVAWSGRHGNTVARIVFRTLLRINDRSSLPDLKQFGSGPPAVRRYFVNVSLAPDRFLAQPSRGINPYTKPQHPVVQLAAMLFSPNIHHDG